MYRSCYNIKLASKLYFHWLFPAIVPNSPQQPSISPQQPSIRQLIESALTDDQLRNLCSDRFDEVYSQFTEGQTRGCRIILLADYVKRQRIEDELLQEIAQLNPNVYREYQQKLREYDSERQYQDLVKNPPKVLIGYAHPPRSNDRRQLLREVADIAHRLRVDGIDCHIDQFEANPPDNLWMDSQLEWANYVLVVCTEQYRDRFQSGQTSIDGRTWQGSVVVGELYSQSQEPLKFIPIIFASGDSQYVPEPLHADWITCYNLEELNGYEFLYRAITQQPYSEGQELRKLRELPPQSIRQSFSSNDTYSNLPTRERDFKLIGREEKIDELMRLISPSHRQFIHVIQGIGGIGKTSLVLEVAYRCLEKRRGRTADDNDFDAFIFTSSKERQFTNYGTLVSRPEKESKLPDIYRVIANTLGVGKITKITDSGEQKKAVYEALSQQSTLLIIDNLESLSTSDREEILDFIRGIPETVQGGQVIVEVIITTRDNLSAMNPSITLDSLDGKDTKALIINQAGSRNITNLSVQQMTDIVKRFLGHPLAIKYALCKIADGFSIDDILVPGADYSIDKIMDFCFKKELEDISNSDNDISDYIARKIFIAMYFFIDSPSGEALKKVVGMCRSGQTESDFDRGLRRLKKISWIIEKEDGRYFMEPTAREYAKIVIERTDLDIRDSMERRFLEYYMEFTKQHGGKDWENWKERYAPLKEQWQNIEFALSRYEAKGDWQNLLKMWEQIDEYVDLSVYWPTRFKWWKTLEKKINNLGTKVKALSEKAWTQILMANTSEHYTIARQWLDEAWNRREDADVLVRADIAHHLAVSWQEEDRKEALVWLDRESAILANSQLPDDDRLKRRQVAKNLYCRAKIDSSKGNLELAKSQFKETSDLCEKIKWFRFRNYAENELAEVLIKIAVVAIERDPTLDFHNIEEITKAESILNDGMQIAKKMEEERRIALYHASFARLYFHKDTQATRRPEADIRRSEYKGKMHYHIEEARNRFDRQGMNPENDALDKIVQEIDRSDNSS